MFGFGKRRRSQQARGRWVPMHESVRIRGRAVAGGFFLGEDIASVSSTHQLEPALISPSLAVRNSRPDTQGQLMGYWPSYSTIEPESRAAYLDWLAAGRPGGAYVGYVFLFFYGIERKLLCEEREDGNSAERDSLVAEIRRLLGLYSDSRSFQSYASDLISTIELRDGSLTTDDLTPPATRAGWDIPLEVKLAVGAFARQGSPVPPQWALGWAVGHPEIPLRTPAKRCANEFAVLFKEKYRAKFGEGMVVSPGSSVLEWQYKPASPSFFGADFSISAPGVADVTRDEASVRELRQITSEATEELAAYSRYIAKNDATSPMAVALLPMELAAKNAPPMVRALAEEVGGDEPRYFPSFSLTEIVTDNSKLTKKGALAVSSLLASQGISIEPDVRFGMVNPLKGESVILWRDPDPIGEVGEGYFAATVLIHMGAAVSASDGEISAIEQRHLEDGLGSAFHLPPAGQRRLHAHLIWLLTEKPGNAGVKARTKEMTSQQRSQVARFMVAVAASDGHVSPEEIDSMKRLYKLLDMDSEAVHGDLHSLASAGPVEVISHDEDPGDFGIPPEPSETAKGLDLDRERLARVISSTDEVRDILTGVFAVDEEPTEAKPEQEPEVEPESTVAGLDPAHSEFVWLAITQPAWAPADLGEVASNLGLMWAGAIEQVNEAAFGICNAPLFEGNDPVEIDPHVVKEMMNA